MQKMTRAALTAALLVAAAPSQAGFFFEGLTPFSIRACEDRPQFAEPVVRAPGLAQPPVIEGTPSALNDGGVPRFRALPCAPARPASKHSAPRRHPAVPQK